MNHNGCRLEINQLMSDCDVICVRMDGVLNHLSSLHKTVYSVLGSSKEAGEISDLISSMKSTFQDQIEELKKCKCSIDEISCVQHDRES